LKNIFFDDEEYWNINKFTPCFIKPETYVLPSDGRFREDLIWLWRSRHAENKESKENYETYSQSWKLLLEIVQRRDREERKKIKKEIEKNKKSKLFFIKYTFKNNYIF
jgi:hypothetical protein